MTVNQVADWVIYLGAVSAALAGIGALLRAVVLVPLRRWLQDQIAGPVQVIHHELTPNGGRSVKDAIDTLRGDMAELRVTLGEHMAASAARSEQIAQIKARLEDHIRNHPGA